MVEAVWCGLVSLKVDASPGGTTTDSKNYLGSACACDGVKESRTSAARTSPDLRTPIALLAGASARTIAPQQLRVTRCTPST
eukprot:COSAG01_NODE_73466_length_244_cov_35.234483_1_plen_81_part_11